MSKLSVVALVLVGTCCGLGGVLSWRTMSLGAAISKGSAEWAEREFTPYLQTWDAARLRALCAPELQNQMSARDMEDITKSFRADLGSYEGPTVARGEGFQAEQGRAFVSVRVEAKFTQRPGVFHLKLVKGPEDGWRLANVKLDSPGAAGSNRAVSDPK